MTSLAAYNWLKAIPAELKKVDQIPLFTYPPSINWELFASTLGEALALPELKIDCGPLELRDKEHLLEDFKDPEVFSFTLAPLEGEIVLLVPRGDFDELLAHSACVETASPLYPHLSDPELKEGFEQFVLLEALFAFQKSFIEKSLSPQIAAESSLPDDACWILDLNLNWTGGSLTCRLLIPQKFRLSWNEKYTDKALSVSPLLMSTLSHEVHIESGRVQLTRGEWDSLNKGDFVILDSCHLVAGEDKGRALLTVRGHPLFRAKIKDGSLKILEYPLFYDVGTTMAKHPSHDEDLNDDLTDQTTEDEHFEEDEFEEEEDELDLPPTPPSESAEHEVSDIKPAEKKLLKAEEIPLDIVIEVGRFQMTLQKLSELQVGNLIELDIHPEQGVDLVVNGTSIAKGELLKVGDTLGVRILDIAK